MRYEIVVYKNINITYYNAIIKKYKFSKNTNTTPIIIHNKHTTIKRRRIIKKNEMISLIVILTIRF